MTNPAPAPQPDLRQRIAEMFPCICIPPFEDGAHWHDCPDCPTGFRKEVEELVAAETAALQAEIERIKRVWEADIRALRRERDELRAQVALAKRYDGRKVEDGVWDHATDCNIWGDDGQGKVNGVYVSIPCSCGAAWNWAKRMESERAEMRRERDELKTIDDVHRSENDALRRELVDVYNERDGARSLLHEVLELYPQTYSCDYGFFEKAHIDPQEWEELRSKIEAVLAGAHGDQGAHGK